MSHEITYLSLSIKPYYHEKALHHFSFFSLFLFYSEELFSQNIAVNTTGAANSTLSMLEVLQISTTANTKGLYIAHSGNISAGNTGYGMQVIKSSMVVAGTNVAGYFSAIGGRQKIFLQQIKERISPLTLLKTEPTFLQSKDS